LNNERPVWFPLADLAAQVRYAWQRGVSDQDKGLHQKVESEEPVPATKFGKSWPDEHKAPIRPFCTGEIAKRIESLRLLGAQGGKCDTSLGVFTWGDLRWLDVVQQKFLTSSITAHIASPPK
jgi:hypothetical protein